MESPKGQSGPWQNPIFDMSLLISNENFNRITDYDLECCMVGQKGKNNITENKIALMIPPMETIISIGD